MPQVTEENDVTKFPLWEGHPFGEKIPAGIEVRKKDNADKTSFVVFLDPLTGKHVDCQLVPMALLMSPDELFKRVGEPMLKALLSNKGILQ